MKFREAALATALACLVGSASACGDDDKPSSPREDGGSSPARAGGVPNTGRDGGPGAPTADATTPRSDAGGGLSDAGGGLSDAGGELSDAGGGGSDGGSDGDGGGEGDDGGAGQDGGAGHDGGDGGVTAPPDGGQPPACNASVAPALPPLKLASVPGAGPLDRLVFAAQPPGSNDWFLAQQTGQVRVLHEGTLRPDSFLDVSSQIALGGPGDERGLLGLAFAPDYATSGKLYVSLSPTQGENAGRDVVLEYTRDTANPYVAAGAAAKTILALEASAPNHNGGNIAFGKDGFLYVGTGDGGGACNSDKRGAPQDVGNLFGKILRLDPKAAGPDFAAAGNPFASGGDARVFLYGLRNPYRFQFDRASGDLYVGDVGQDRYEEVDYIPAGQGGLNLGWPKYEGDHVDHCPGSVGLRAGSTHYEPIVDINRQAGATGDFADYKSIITAPVYRGSAIPQLAGVFLFGDYLGVRLGALVQCGTSTSPIAPLLKNKNVNTPNAAGFTRESGLPPFADLTAIVEDNAGELYMVFNRDRLVKVVPGP